MLLSLQRSLPLHDTVITHYRRVFRSSSGCPGLHPFFNALLHIYKHTLLINTDYTAKIDVYFLSVIYDSNMTRPSSRCKFRYLLVQCYRVISCDEQYEAVIFLCEFRLHLSQY